MSRLSRALRVRPGEGRVVAFGAAMMVAAEAGGAFGQSGIDALFFATAPAARLAQAVVVSGVLMLGVSMGLTALTGRVAPERLFVALPAGAAVVLVTGRALLETGAGWVLPGMWLTATAVQLAQALSTWGLVGTVTDVRQAKRLFPVLGAARILGAVGGGLATRPLADLVGAANLVLVWAAGLAAAAAFGAAMVRRRRGVPAPVRRGDAGLRPLVASPLVRWMAVAAVLFSVLFYLLYVPFSQGAAAAFGDPDALAGFLGLFWAGTAAGGFVLSLAVGNRLYARFGVAAAIAVLPVVYLAGFGVLLASGGFVALLAIRVVQMLWMSGIVGPAWEAVVNVLPGDRRDRVRALLNGAASQTGTALGGLLHLAVAQRHLYPVGLAAAGLAAFACWRVRRAYAPALLATLRAQWPRVFTKGSRRPPVRCGVRHPGGPRRHPRPRSRHPVDGRRDARRHRRVPRRPPRSPRPPRATGTRACGRRRYGHWPASATRGRSTRRCGRACATRRRRCAGPPSGRSTS